MLLFIIQSGPVCNIHFEELSCYDCITAESILIFIKKPEIIIKIKSIMSNLVVSIRRNDVTRIYCIKHTAVITFLAIFVGYLPHPLYKRIFIILIIIKEIAQSYKFRRCKQILICLIERIT